MNRDRANADQGFTLVEMLVVLSVIGLMSALMLSMTGQFRSLIAADRSISERAALQKTANHIATLLENLETLPLERGKEGSVQFLESSGSNLRFLGVSRHQDSPSSLLEYSIKLESSAVGQSLVEIQAPRRASIAEIQAFKVVLLQNVKSLSFAFLDPVQPNVGPINWRADWQNTPRLAKAIRITIAKLDKSGRTIQVTATARISRQNQ
jgi:prepilin-type N-terminal cleavage/methylation domain-containing protein